MAWNCKAENGLKKNSFLIYGVLYEMLETRRLNKTKRNNKIITEGECNLYNI